MIVKLHFHTGKVPPFGFVYILNYKKAFLQCDLAHRCSTTLSDWDIVIILKLELKLD